VFLGLGDSLPPAVRFTLFVVVVGLTLAFVAWYLVTAAHLGRRRVLCLTFILAGGIGNLIDRIAYHGVVVDFLNIGIGGLRTGVFNVADMAVTAGVIALALTGSLGPPKPRTKAEPPEPTAEGTEDSLLR
jgi:signal peptidase II